MGRVVLLTGASGFLGTQVARRLLEAEDLSLIALVGADGPAQATADLSRAWWDWPELVRAIPSRVEALAGDVSQTRLGLSERAYDDLVRRLTHVVHAAADLRVGEPINVLRATNVEGTAHLLALARAVHLHHGLIRFSHISTAYVAGRRHGVICEDALSDAYGFFNAYEQSKFEGERLVAAAQADLPVSILRPGMIVGDSRTGAVKTFNTVYVPLRLYMSERLRVLPARASLRLNVIPVDYVADAVVRLTFLPEAAGVTVHLTASHNTLPTAAELVGFARAWSREHLGVRLPRPAFVPSAGPWARRRQHPGRPDQLVALQPYLKGDKVFERVNTDRLLGANAPDWRAYLPHVLEYAAYHGFMHRSGRTVHEQVLFRLGSSTRPVRYHDVIEGQVVTRDAASERCEIRAAATALRALGVGPGDRVALTGFNSSRYLVLDTAVGLVGAVSVPLYYTSPPAEIRAIVEASGARLLFVGASALLAKLGALAGRARVISFCRDEARLPDGVMPWSAFLSLQSEGPDVAPSFGDLATLRYTSGTTGAPKGVAFDHGELRWMARCMASLLPWRARTAPVRYLSFLPLNHVVEGILTAYGGYYLPAPIDIFFLEDFRDLERALPNVRPTLFFSVPRFYEKAWQGLTRTSLGGWYVRAPSRPERQLARPVIRRLFLRKVGLDRCVQLLVGSAPVDATLLASYRALGIDVHNAYGLTEAPLLTLNRLGANRLGTAGHPLPETELCIAWDGEVLAKGPQVTRGYAGGVVPQPFRDGWLLTGDLGSVTEDGYLVIEGRKKELIATAYGKKVQPAKVEGLLKAIPGVAEAMLVGEARPYCVALLWLEPGARDVESIGRAVEHVNTQLSHPEQVKRWALLENDLSSERGELTANLKLKRKVVAERFAPVIGALYAGGAPPGTVRAGDSRTDCEGAAVMVERA